MKKLIRLFVLLVLLWTIDCGLSTAYADTPRLLNYQGRLTDKSGRPLTGSYEVTFKIYDAENAGTLKWEETHPSVVIEKGVFSVLLGSVKNLDLAFDQQYYLEIQVGDDAMSPRQKIASAAYAIKAESAEQADNADTVGNVGVSVTPQANKLLPLDANAKLPAVDGSQLTNLGEFVETMDGWIMAAGLSKMSKVDINRLFYGGTNADNLFYILCLDQGISHNWKQMGPTVKTYVNENTGKIITIQLRGRGFESIGQVRGTLGGTTVEVQLWNGSVGETTYTATFDFSAEQYGAKDFKVEFRNAAGGGQMYLYRGILCFWGNSATSTQSTVWQTIKYNVSTGQSITVPCTSDKIQLYENRSLFGESIGNYGINFGGSNIGIQDYKFQVKPLAWQD